MQLGQLLDGMAYSLDRGSVDIEIDSIQYDSRHACPKALFVCMAGAVTDGHQYAANAYAAGVRAFLCSKPIAVGDDATVIIIRDGRYALAYVSARFYGHPSGTLKVIGVTGTKGKTSITYMVKAMLEKAGHPCGIIGTVATFDGKEYCPAKNTTPESLELQKLFRNMLDNGCAYCVMEVSSQAIKLNRTACIDFDAAVFSNISPDHIGPAEHKDFEEYLACKAALFKTARTAYINIDDAHSNYIIDNTSGTVKTYGIIHKADLTASAIELLREDNRLGVLFNLNVDDKVYKVELGTPGTFSIYNALAALCIARHIDMDMDTAIEALKHASVKGRMELLKLDLPFTVIVDYAHNAVSLENVLTTLRKYETTRIITLFGCGGNRDRNRRFEMGEVSGRLSHLTLITSDNPRNEEPEAIIADIVTGIQKTNGAYLTIPNRREAIEWALDHAQPGDIVLVAGKGHEDYQEIKGVKYPFDDSIVIYETVEAKR